MRFVIRKISENKVNFSGRARELVSVIVSGRKKPANAVTAGAVLRDETKQELYPNLNRGGAPNTGKSKRTVTPARISESARKAIEDNEVVAFLSSVVSSQIKVKESRTTKSGDAYEIFRDPNMTERMGAAKLLIETACPKGSIQITVSALEFTAALICKVREYVDPLDKEIFALIKSDTIQLIEEHFRYGHNEKELESMLGELGFTKVVDPPEAAQDHKTSQIKKTKTKANPPKVNGVTKSRTKRTPKRENE